MKRQAKIALILLSIVTVTASAQDSSGDQGLRARTHLLGYWLDPSTRLVWTRTDNGENVNRYQASDYCRDLGYKGYSNWRLPTIDELETIYEPGATTQRKLPHYFSQEPAVAAALNVKGNLSVTGDPWSSSDINTDHAHPSNYGWSFNFNKGSRIQDELASATDKRAICVRRSDVIVPLKSAGMIEPPASENQSRGYWVDSSTGLVWAAKDSGKSVTWGHARKYCHDLRLAGYSDWRLATLDELETLAVNGAYDPHRVDNTDYLVVAVAGSRDVRGGVNLTDDPWSSNRPLDRFHHPYSDGWFFDFRTSQPSYDLQLFRNIKSALCVRRPEE
ncbi:MAG: DUF1566 domain-containing protein [Terracidiphilus sp.]